MFNCIFGDQVKKQNFSTFHMRILEIQELFSSSHHLTPQSADVILVQAETIKSFTIFFTYVLDYYADAKQSALEIRISFFFFMVVANCNASCYWLHVHCSQCQLLLFFHPDSRLHLSQHGRFHAVSFETAFKTRCTNPLLSQLVAKCEQILCMSSCEFDQRAREAKICCQSRPALY